MTGNETHWRMLLESADLRALEVDKNEHPFTYCMKSVVPAMAEKGKEPSDPEAFCGWWKMEHAAEFDPEFEIDESSESEEIEESELETLGGQGSGNFGHEGRPGQVGGSGGGGGGKFYGGERVVKGSRKGYTYAPDRKKPGMISVRWDNGKITREKLSAIKRFKPKKERQGEREEIYNMEGARHLHILAGGSVRTEKLHGRDHLVVPVIALMEGVIHAVNAETPEFVPSDLLRRAAHTWNGRPLVLGHPTKDGRQISANDPGVMQKQAFGQIFESKINGTRLGMEAWIDPQRLVDLGEHELLAQVRAGKPIEVSVGAYVRTLAKEGKHNGRPYKAEWLEATGDHLAFLPKGRGACSIEMGCGACRAAEEHPRLYTLEGAEPAEVITIDAMQPEVVAKWLEENHEKFVAAIGARNNSNDSKTIQSMHDSAVALGAKCDRANYKMLEGKATECGCKKSAKGDRTMSMDKQKKAELIAALVTDKHSGFKEGDEALLEAASDTQLEGFRAAAETRKTEAEAKEKLENDLRAANAKLKVTDEKLKAASEKPTEEQWMENAPASIKALIERQKQQEAEEREQLITHLKTAQEEYKEDELKTFETSMLQRLAKVAKVETPNYSGRKTVVRAATEKEDYTPPDPYAAGVKALQGQAKVN